MEPCESNVVPACSVTSDSLWPYGLQPARLFCPWDSPGKNTGEGCHALLQGIYLTQGSNWHLLGFLHWQTESLPLWHLGSQVSQAMRTQFCCYWISYVSAKLCMPINVRCHWLLSLHAGHFGHEISEGHKRRRHHDGGGSIFPFFIKDLRFSKLLRSYWRKSYFRRKQLIHYERTFSHSSLSNLNLKIQKLLYLHFWVILNTK